MSKDETIDLKNLNQKELLILVYERQKETGRAVAEMKGSLEKVTQEYIKLSLKVNTLEVKVAMYGAGAGIVGTLIVQLIIFLLKH